MSPEQRGVLFLQHQRSVVRTIQKQYPFIDEDTLENLYSDLWFTVTRLNRVNQTTFKTFLVTAFRNAIKNHIRDSSRSQDVLSRFQVLSLSDPETIEAADTYSFATRTCVMPSDGEATSERYEAIMSGVPPTLRLVAELYYIDGCTQEEIACHFQTNRAKVVRLIEKATSIIKKRYQYYKIAVGKHELNLH